MLVHRPSGARLAGLAHALPPHVLDREGTLAALLALFPDEDPGFVARLVENSGVARRHFVPTVEEVLAHPDVRARNERYRLAALDLAEEACRGALERAGLAPGEVDCVIDVSCTGIAIPALDVDLVPRLGLPATTRRIPITESGCAAGALGLGLAASLASGGARVLLVAVELCSLTLSEGARSRTSLVASVLFGDGAAAAVVTPAEGPRARAGPRIAAVGSVLIPETRGTMGFELSSQGLSIVLGRELPAILRRHLPGALDAFLDAAGLGREDVRHHLVHPGGRRILDAYEELFELPPDALRHARTALSTSGNLSSASILMVLELHLDEVRGREPADVGRALVTGVGPGLSLELLLLEPA